jgi:uncharacterized OB-fold protein
VSGPLISDHRGHPVIEDRWDMLHRHPLGRAGEALVSGLERGELVAARCPACSRVLLPPRTFCERCFVETELITFEGRLGTLLSFTVVRRPFTGSPEIPFAIGYARLAGADTAIGALVDGVDLGPEVGDPPLAVGMAVELVIRDDQTGIGRLRLTPAGES